MISAEEAGREIDERLAELRGSSDPRAGAAAEELVGTLVHLYGEGLARIADMLGPDRVTALAADPLVASLLLVHDLHPVPMQERLREAFDSSGVQLLGVDEAGVVRLRTTGRPGARREIEAVVRRVAPEATGVDVTDLPLLQVTMRPGAGRATS